MEEARHEVYSLLDSIELNEFLLTKPPCGVFTISPDTNLAGALHRLAAANVISAPLVSDDNEYCGFVEVMDILSAIFEGGQWNAEASAAEQLPAIAAFLQETPVSEIPRSNDAEVLYRTQGKVTLLEIVKKGFVRPAFKLWCHRLAIVDANDTSFGVSGGRGGGGGSTNGTTQRGAKKEIISIFSQSDVMRYLNTHSNHIPTFMATPITQFGLGKKAVFFVPHDMPAAEAFRTMLLASGVTSAAVLRKGKLVANLSPTDLRGIAPEELAQLDLPVLEFLATRNHRGDSVHVPGSLASIYGVKSPRKASMSARNGTVNEHALSCVSTSATMGQLVSLLAERGVHRVYVKEDRNDGEEEIEGDGVGGLCGVVSLSDILTAVIGP
jgi:CBS domain-containing protein